MSPDHGGAGANFFSAILVIEELAKVDPTVSAICDAQNTLVLEMLHKNASKQLQQKYLPKLSKNLVCKDTDELNNSILFTCVFKLNIYFET